MSMKKLADAAMLELNNRMESYSGSLGPTSDEIHMAAMTCRIQELEAALSELMDKASECDSWESFPEQYLEDARKALSE